jgi:hypothetical protein
MVVSLSTWKIEGFYRRGCLRAALSVSDTASFFSVDARKVPTKSGPNLLPMTKTCSGCKKKRDLSLFHRDGSKPDGLAASCKRCKKMRREAAPEQTKLARKEYQRKWNEAHPHYSRLQSQKNRTELKAKRLVYLYGITPDQFRSMRLAQGDACAVCKAPFGSRTPHVDHDHVTKKARGLLCGDCNRFRVGANTLATAREVVAYLEKFGA